MRTGIVHMTEQSSTQLAGKLCRSGRVAVLHAGLIDRLSRDQAVY